MRRNRILKITVNNISNAEFPSWKPWVFDKRIPIGRSQSPIFRSQSFSLSKELQLPFFDVYCFKKASKTSTKLPLCHLTGLRSFTDKLSLSVLENQQTVFHRYKSLWMDEFLWMTFWCWNSFNQKKKNYFYVLARNF